MKDFDFSDGVGIVLVCILVLTITYWAGSILTKARIETDCNRIGTTIMNSRLYTCAKVEEG